MDDEVEFWKLLHSLDAIQRQIIELSRERVSDEKIADTVKRSLRTVRRERMRFEQEVQRRKRTARAPLESSDSRNG